MSESGMKDGFVYQIEKTPSGGVYMTDPQTGATAYRVNSGTWFWLAGTPCNPFDEDVILSSLEGRKLDALLRQQTPF